jgi:hypothetical protein
MGLPNINIEFSTAAATAIERSEKGIVGIILKDAAGAGTKAYALTKPTQVSTLLSALGTENQDYVKRTFIGYINPPKKVIAYVLPDTATNLAEALDYFVGETVDYLVGPPDCTIAEATEISTWIKSQRADGRTFKAVLPNIEADSEGVINFTTGGIAVGDKTYTAAQYCSRIAGLIAGTPMTISCTYAPLSEVSSVDKLSKDEIDAAIDAGKFVIFYDGEKVKVGRGVNSLQTTTQDKGEAFKKIKIVEAIDMIRTDIETTAEDSYIGKYANSYDNKCLLISAIKGYFTGLENDGILESGSSTVDIDIEAQEAYLQSKGIDTTDMTEQEIKEAATDDQVFLKATIKILDAIEDISLSITI